MGYLQRMARHPKRPRDMMQLAKAVGDIATGTESDEQRSADPKASKRGAARAAKLSRQRRKAIAKKAAKARWKRTK